MAAVDHDGVAGGVVVLARQEVVEDAGTRGTAVRADLSAVETNNLQERCQLTGVPDPGALYSTVQYNTVQYSRV